MLAVVIVEGVAIALLGLLVIGLLRSHADILRALHDLGAGLEDEDGGAPVRSSAAAGGASGLTYSSGKAYDVAGLLPDDSAAAVSVVGAKQDTVLAFLSTSCLSCEPFWETFAEPHPLPENGRLVVVVQEGDNLSKLRKLAPRDVLVVRSDDAWREYEIPGSPHFVHVAAGGAAVTGEGTAETWDQVLDLLVHGGATAPGGPGAPGAAGPVITELPEGRDNPERIDRELAKSGIGPGHPSLHASLDQPDEDA